MDLREKIAEAIEKHEASPTKAYLILDAVMGVVEGDAEKRRAYTEGRVELARKAEATIWERRIREQKEEGDAIIAEEQARVRELEDENQRMRDDIAARIIADEQKCQEAITTDPTNAWMQGRLVGLQRARDIAGQATVDPSPRNPRQVQ